MENHDPIKINLVINMTSMFHCVYEEKLQAIEMADNFFSFIQKDHRKDAPVRKLKLQLKSWLLELETANIDNEWLSDDGPSERS